MENIDLLLKDMVGKYVGIFFGEYLVEKDKNDGYSEIMSYGTIKVIKGRWLELQETESSDSLFVNIDHIQYFTVVKNKQTYSKRIEQLEVKRTQIKKGNNIEI